jgi:hypothetical protein
MDFHSLRNYLIYGYKLVALLMPLLLAVWKIMRNQEAQKGQSTLNNL